MLDSNAGALRVTNEPVSNEEKKPAKSSGLLLGLIGVLVLVVIALGAYVAGRETTHKSASTSDTKSSSAASSAPKYDYGILNQISDTLNREYVKPDNLNAQ